MSNRYQLVELKNEEVLSGVSRLVAQSNQLTADLLAHLVEVDARMLYAELGFPHLFAYCVESLGLSEGAAGRRCTATKLCRRFPEAFELVASGELHLSALCALADHVQPENAAELFAACRQKSRRKVDAILAARFPVPDAKEQVRHLPRRREIQPTAADRYKVQFMADAKLHQLIERALELCPDRSPDGQLAKVVTQALEQYVAQQERRRFAVGRKPRKANVSSAGMREGDAQSTPPGGVVSSRRSTPPSGVRRRRAITAAVRREVYERDQGRCTWVAKDGRRCGARAAVQFDHAGKPWAMGGGDEAFNLRLLCPSHNRLYARHCFGALHVAAKIAARRRDRQPARQSRGGEAGARG